MATLNTNFATAITGVVTSLTAAEKLAFSELLMTKAFGANKLTEAYPVLTGVRHGSLVPILSDNQDYGAFPFRTLGSCDVSICELDANFSTVKFEMGNVECKIPVCLESFEQDFHKFFGEYKKASGEVDEQSAILQFLANLFVENLVRAEWRGAWFGDKLSANTLLNGINGFFTQMQARTAQVIAIAENAAATFVGQKALTGAQVVGILKKMYDQYADAAWYGTPNVRFEMTSLTAQKLVAYMNDLSITDPNCCNGVVRTSIDGVLSSAYTDANLSFLGIPIVVRREWDGVINSAKVYPLNQGANARVKPFRIVLTSRDNLVIGCSNTDQISRFKTWFSQDQNKVFIQGGSEIGAHIPLVDEFILAI